jgi:hypothetical protein
MERKYIIQGPPPELPATVQEWKDSRTAKVKMSVNDGIEATHLAMIKERNGAYLNLIKGRKNDETVHGSIVIDQTVAAQMLAEKAKEMELEVLQGVKLVVLYKGLNSMLSHRYGKSRHQNAMRDRVLIENVNSNAGE